MDIYIIVKQIFFNDYNGHHYQIADDNPIVMVHKSLDEAKRTCDHLAHAWLQRYPGQKLKISYPSSEFVAKYGLYTDDNYEISYNIVKEYAI